MRGFAVGALALAVAGCGSSDMDLAREAVANQMKDPGSATFRNERRLENGSICGEVNGKNEFGGYVGFVPFLATKKPDGFDSTIDADFSDRFASKACGYTIKNAQPAMEIPGLKWSVQAASASSEESAKQIIDELSSLGMKPYLRRGDGKIRVFIGPFPTRAEAESVADDLAAKKTLKSFVLRYQESEG